MAHTHKSNRSLAKRIKITGTGRVFKRKPGQNHFNAKNTGAEGLAKRGFKESPKSFAKSFQALLPGEGIAS